MICLFTSFALKNTAPFTTRRITGETQADMSGKYSREAIAILKLSLSTVMINAANDSTSSMRENINSARILTVTALLNS